MLDLLAWSTSRARRAVLPAPYASQLVDFKLSRPSAVPPFWQGAGLRGTCLSAESPCRLWAAPRASYGRETGLERCRGGVRFFILPRERPTFVADISGRAPLFRRYKPLADGPRCPPAPAAQKPGPATPHGPNSWPSPQELSFGSTRPGRRGELHRAYSSSLRLQEAPSSPARARCASLKPRNPASASARIGGTLPEGSPAGAPPPRRPSERTRRHPRLPREAPPAL